MITIVRTVQTSIACPSQWDAWDADGNYYYLRYRHGCGAVRQYRDENWTDRTYEEAVGDGRTVASFEHGDPLDGTISLPEFAELAGIMLAENLAETGFGDYVRDELVTRYGMTGLLDDER